MTTALGRSGRPGPRRALGLLAAAALALGPVVLPVLDPGRAGQLGGSASAAVLAASPTGVRVELEQLGPTALVPGADLVVRARVTNLTGAAVSGARARLFVNSPVLADRASVAAWAAGEGVQGGDRFAGVSGAEQPLDVTLAPGASTEVSFTVDADELRLGEEFGPRGVTVDVLDSSLQRLAALRTFLVWMPQSSPPATAGLTVLAPVVAGAPDVATAQLPASSLESQVGPDGRLSRLLTAAAASPSTTLVIDPAVLGPFAQPSRAGASGDPAAPDPSTATSSAGSSTGAPSESSSPAATSDPTSAGGTGDVPDLVAGQPADVSQAASAWLAQLDGRTTGSVVALPQGDVDVLSAASAGADRLLPLALSQSSASAVAQTGDAPAAQLVWPVDATAAAPVVLAASAAVESLDGAAGAPATASPSDPATSSETTEAPVRLVVLDAAAVPGAVSDRGTSPASVVATATAADGSAASARAVLVDAADSALLASATDVTDDTGDTGDTGAAGGAADGGPALTAARLLADSAVAASAQAPADDLVLALPRDWDPDPSAAFAVLSPLSTAPWVRSTPLTDLLAQEPSQVVSVDGATATTTATTTAPSLPTAGLRQAQDAVTATTSVSRLVDEPQALLDPVERSAVAAASLGWRSRQEGWPPQLAALSERAEQLGRAVTIVSGGAVFSINSQFYLPVTVRNDLPQAVRVLVSMSSTSYRLVAGEPQPLTIPAGAQDTVRLPVRAVASGDTSVTVALTDADSSPIGEPAPLRVRVRADWEGRGVAIAAGITVLVLLGGITRTVVRVRRRPRTPVVRSAEEADADGPPRSAPLRPEESSRG